MYKIKEKIDDFIVEEKIQLKLDDSGSYAYFWLSKKGYTTQRAMDKISGFLRCRVRDIGFAGNKDKQAVTRQAISIKDPSSRINSDRFEVFNSELLSLEYIGRGGNPVSLGDLDGNEFKIVIRDCDNEPHKIEQLINYFDEQRFSETNVGVGKAIVKGDMKTACSLIQADDVRMHLEKSPNDCVGAMKHLPLKIRMLFVHAYQSWIWNETVSKYLQCKYNGSEIIQYKFGKLVFPKQVVEDTNVPIIGFGSEDVYGDVGNIIKEIMKKESITKRDFIIRQMPELSAEGGMRDIAVAVSNLEIEKKGDKEYMIKFLLQKGSYATMAVKQMMA